MKKFSIALFLTLALLASAASQTVMTNQNLVDFTSGVVKILTANNQDLSACLSSEKQVAQVIFTGIQAFEQKNEQGILQGLSIIESSFETVAQTLKSCQVLAEDVENFVNKIKGFSNIKTLIFEAGKQLILNDVEIFQEIDTAVTEYKNKEYTQSGEQFGYALEKIFQNSMKSESVELITIPSDVKIDATAFLIGFLEALGNQNDISSLTDIATCVTPNTLFNVEEVVYTTLDQIENTTDYTQVKPIIIQAIKQLGQVFESVPEDLVSCGISQTLIDRVKEFVVLCKNTKQLESTVETNWKKNLFSLLVEAGSLVNDIKIKNWENIGKDFGNVVDQLLLTQTSTLETESSEMITIPADVKIDATAFLIGFLESLGNQNDISSLTDIATCVTPNAVFSLESVIYTAISQIEATNDYTQVKPIIVETIKSLGQAIEQVPEDLVSCGISQTLIDRVKEFVALCKNTKQLETTFDSNWKKNILSLILQVGSIYSDIKSKNWENIGKDFGNVIDELLLPTQTEEMTQFFSLKQTAVQIVVDPQNFILGTLIGLTGNQKAEQLFSNTECLAQSEISQIKEPIANIITLIKNKNYLSIVMQLGDLLKTLVMSLKTLPEQLSGCGVNVDVVAQIKSDFEKLKNPVGLAKAIFSDILTDKSLVLEYSSSMEQSLEKNDWMSVGMFFGELLEKIFIEPQQSEDEMMSFFSIQTEASQVSGYVKDLVYGIIGGISHSDDADALFSSSSCALMNDFDQMLPTIKNIIAVIKEKDYAELITYVIDLVKGFANEAELLTLQMRQCGATDAQMNKMMTLVEAIKDPKKTLSYLWGNINSNQLYMMQLFKSVITDAKNKDVLQVGYDLGEILAQIYFGANAEDQYMSFMSVSDIKTDAFNDFMFVHNAILDFSLGFIGGYANNADFQSLVTAYGCMEMNHVNLLVDPVKSIMAAIKTKNWEGIITNAEEIIVDISTLMQNIPDQLMNCGVSTEEQAKFELLKSSLKNPLPLMKFFFNNIKSNGQDLFLTAEQMIVNFQAKDFNNAGWQFGTIMQYILMGKSVNTEEMMSFISIQDGVKKVESEAKTVFSSIKDQATTVGLGFISGLSESQQAQNIFNNFPCLLSNGFTNVIPAFENVVNSIKQKQIKEALTNLMSAVESVFYAYINVPTTLQICGLDEQDVEILANYINVFQQPIETLKLIQGNVKQNEVELLLLLQQMVQSVEKKDLQGLGLYAGLVYDNVFLGPTQAYDPSSDEETMMLTTQDKQLIADGKQFLTGFFNGLKMENAEQSVECVGEEEITQVLKQFKSLVAGISQNVNIFNIQSVLTNALSQLTNDVQQIKNIPNELIQCGLTKQSISSLTQIFDLFENKANFEQAVKTDIEQNGLTMLENVFTVVQNFNEQNWSQVGQGLGSMLYEISQIKPTKSQFKFLTK